MPIYEFACPKCRKIFSFLSKRVSPDRPPVCPKCGEKKMTKQVSRFALTRGASEAPEGGGSQLGDMPDMNDPRIARAMAQIDREIEHMDENNPRHMAHMMRRIKELMPPGSTPKDLDIAIKRLEAGEDPEKVEAEMGDMLGDFLGDESAGQGGAGYTRDTGLYDY